MVIDGKTLVLWLPAIIVSATDESYQMIYEGKLPRDNPFSTVDVPLHHVWPIMPTPPPPPSQPPFAAAASLSSSVSKNGGMHAARSPRTAAKIIRGLKAEKQPPRMPVLTHAARSSSSAGETLVAAASESSEMPPPARPTTAAKSPRFSRNRASEMEMQPARRPTTAGKSLHKPKSGMKHTSRPTTAGKSLGLFRELTPEVKKPSPRPTTAGKRISVIRRTLSEKDRQVLDACCLLRARIRRS
jgi:hypothetical protein